MTGCDNFFYLIPDVNECDINANDCATDATCVNTNGSFTCACNQGFEGDGTLCQGTRFSFRPDVQEALEN